MSSRVNKILQEVESLNQEEREELRSVLDSVLHQPSEALTPLEVFRLPIEERRKLLARQAENLVSYYESTAKEREEWQGGDIPGLIEQVAAAIGTVVEVPK